MAAGEMSGQLHSLSWRNAAVLDSWHILHLHDKQVKQQVRCQRTRILHTA
jgi:hypothetical protein